MLPPPAGSGKTTLLAILAGSAEDLDKRSSLSGTVLLDGQPLRSATRRKVRLAGLTGQTSPLALPSRCLPVHAALLRMSL